MKNKILRVAAVAVMLVLMATSLTACGKEKQYPEIKEKTFVNDYADVITEQDEITITNKAKQLEQKTSAQAVVVTVESLDGEPIEEYALNLGRTWGVGDKEKNNGIIVLLSKNDREIYIAVGYGLEGALPDSKTGRIIDHYGMTYFQSDNFSAGLESIYGAIVNEIYVEYGETPEENYIPVMQLSSKKEDSEIGEIIISWVILIIIVSLYMLVFGRRGGLFIFGSPRFFTGGYHGDFSGGSFGGFKGGGGFGGGSFGGGGAGRKF
ncbi:MAG: TPM domain-containing protein [Clostridia bacterium]|nr:TPM domain-containing protein [Clostridia bacterium]